MLIVSARGKLIKDMSDKNFSYGAYIGVKTTERSKAFAGKSHLDRSYIFIQGDDWGKIELGSNEGPARAMKLHGGSVNASEGSWERYVSLDTFVSPAYTTPAMRSDNFITFSKLVLQEASYEVNHEAFRKITYYTPKIKGVQLGIAYIPDATNRGGTALLPTSATSARDEKNAFSGGISWEKSFKDNHNITLSVVGEIGEMKSSPTDITNGRSFHRSNAFVVGGKYVKDKYSFAASYGNRGKSGFQKNITNGPAGPIISVPDTYSYSVGGAYQVCDKCAVSLTYLHTNMNKNTLDVISLGGSYNMFEGVKTYAEFSYFTAKQTRDYVISGPNPDDTPGPEGITKAVMFTGQNYKNCESALVFGTKVSF